MHSVCESPAREALPLRQANLQSFAQDRGDGAYASRSACSPQIAWRGYPSRSDLNRQQENHRADRASKRLTQPAASAAQLEIHWSLSSWDGSRRSSGRIVQACRFEVMQERAVRSLQPCSRRAGKRWTRVVLPQGGLRTQQMASTVRLRANG